MLPTFPQTLQPSCNKTCSVTNCWYRLRSNLRTLPCISKTKYSGDKISLEKAVSKISSMMLSPKEKCDLVLPNI